MNIRLYTNVTMSLFFHLLRSLDIVIIHVPDYQVTVYSDNFKDFFKYNNRRGEFQ